MGEIADAIAAGEHWYQLKKAKEAKVEVPRCTCDFTWEEMDAAASPWHRKGCPQGEPSPIESR